MQPEHVAPRPNEQPVARFVVRALPRTAFGRLIDCRQLRPVALSVVGDFLRTAHADRHGQGLNGYLRIGERDGVILIVAFFGEGAGRRVGLLAGPHARAFHRKHAVVRQAELGRELSGFCIHLKAGYRAVVPVDGGHCIGRNRPLEGGDAVDQLNRDGLGRHLQLAPFFRNIVVVGVRHRGQRIAAFVVDLAHVGQARRAHLGELIAAYQLVFTVDFIGPLRRAAVDGQFVAMRRGSVIDLGCASRHDLHGELVDRQHARRRRVGEQGRHVLAALADGEGGDLGVRASGVRQAAGHGHFRRIALQRGVHRHGGVCRRGGQRRAVVGFFRRRQDRHDFGARHRQCALGVLHVGEIGGYVLVVQVNLMGFDHIIAEAHIRQRACVGHGGHHGEPFRKARGLRRRQRRAVIFLCGRRRREQHFRGILCHCQGA